MAQPGALEVTPRGTNHVTHVQKAPRSPDSRVSLWVPHSPQTVPTGLPTCPGGQPRPPPTSDRGHTFLKKVYCTFIQGKEELGSLLVCIFKQSQDKKKSLVERKRKE